MAIEGRSLRELFELAREMPVAQREEFLSNHCPDPETRERVLRMLALADAGASALTPTSAEDLARDIDEAVEKFSFVLGERIGPFELRAVIGQGGSATVFRAERVLDDVH